jgi:hypothetical protein
MTGANVLRANARWLHFQPLPMPAVALCDYDVHDYDERDDASNVKTDAASFSMASEITMTSSNDGNSPRFLGNNYRVGGGSTPGGSGGSKGPPHRCPKCGATVTFQESSAASSSNRIQNCFYCAACSGWFLVQPQSSQNAEEHSKYLLSKMSSAEAGQVGDKKEHGIPTNRNVLEPQFVMQDVSLLSFETSCTLSSPRVQCHVLISRLDVIHYLVTFHSDSLLFLSRYDLLTSPCFSSLSNTHCLNPPGSR